MGCTPSTPANSSNNNGGAGGNQRAPDAASGEKAATFAASNKAAASQQQQHHRKGSLILTTTTSPALDGTSTRTSPTSVGTFYPNSAVDHPSPEEDSTRTGSSHRNSSGNHSNNNTVLCCPRLFGFSCCQQCVYRANSGGSGSNRGGGGGGQRHHPYQNQQQQQQKQKQKRTISASLTGLHSMLDPECPSTGSNNKNWQLSTANNSSSTRSSCASLCSVCQQQQQLPQEQQPPVIISVNKATSQQQQQQQQQWHLSTTGNCGSSSTSSDKKADKKKGASKKKKNSEKDNAVMRFGGGGGGGNATSLSSKDSEKLLLSHHNTTTATRESTDAADGAGGSGNVDEGQQQQQCCLKHQHRYYRQLYSGGGDPHHQHHCHCPSSSSSSSALVVCPALPKCAHSSCSHSSQAVVVSSPQQQQSDTTNFISSSLHQQTTAANASSPADNSAAALNRRQSETRTSGAVNNNNNNNNSNIGAVNSNRGGNGSSGGGNRYQHQLQQSTSPISSSNSNNNTSVTTNSALLFDISSSKGKSMEKTAAAAVAGSATSGALFRDGSSTGKKHWASQSVRLGRMRIENKRAKALLVLETADSAAGTVQQAAEQVDFSLSTVLHSAEAAFNAFVEHQPEVVIIDARRRGDVSTTTRTVTATNNNNNGSSSYQHNDSSANNRSSSNGNGNHFDPLTICKSIRDFKGGEFTCILALVSREQAEGESDAVSLLLQGGFNRCLVSSDRLSATVNELLQVREYELTVQRRLRAASALLVAVEACKDGVLITGPQHTIQYANGSIEKMFGFRVEELLGHQAQDYFQTDRLKPEIDERINNFNDGKGEWEGQIAHRRKSGDSVPIWNRILPVNYHNGSPEYIIYVKEFPFLFIEKLMSPETSDSSLTYGSLRGLRKTSFDVKSEVRRPSLAKFNSVSMIEAPITRVINILMAIKENGPSFLAPTLEKAIDILKNSEIFLPQFQSFKPEDQITSELVSSLINSSKQSGVRRMSHEAASNKSSLSLQANSNSAPITALQPPPSPSITSAGNSSSSSTTSASQSVTTTATANLLPLNSIATTSTSTGGQPSLSNVPSAVQALLEHQLDWNFNVIELERVTNKRPLTWLGMSILRHFNVPSTLQCSEAVIRNWLAVIEANYHDNPYHNSTHAADVMQATAFFLRSKRIAAALDPMDQAISLIAAIIHDIDHPGRNSAFLCNSSHQLAILYNDISVLESHHAARGFALTVGGEDGSKSNPEHSVNIFAALGPELYRDVRQSVIDMVLATDMTKHFEHLAKFIQNFNAVGGAAGISGALADDCETLLELENTESEADSQDTLGGGAGAGAGTAAEGANAGDLTPENIVLIKRMLIKCADVSNPARPLKLCQTWAERISTEYCDQTDEEKRLGLKVVMPTFDRATCSIPKSQIGFIDYFANDLFEAWHSFGDFPETVDNMNLNYQYWKDQQALLERKAKKLSLESTKVSEADEDEEAAEAEEAFAEEDEGSSSSVSAKL